MKNITTVLSLIVSCETCLTKTYLTRIINIHTPVARRPHVPRPVRVLSEQCLLTADWQTLSSVDGSSATTQWSSP
jgi:hypothetical protein